ncbi:MAG: TRAP transporter small permease [Alkalispirochaetaceae bacterium]
MRLRLFRWIVKLFDTLFFIAIMLAQALLVMMTLLIGANVFMRYLLNSGIHWAEEISLVMAVTFVFIAMALGVRKKLHISLHLWRRPIPKLDTVLEKLADLVVLFVGIVLFIYGRILIQFTMRSIMPATKLPSALLYMVVPLAAVLMIYEAITDLIGFDTDAHAQLGGDQHEVGGDSIILTPEQLGERGTPDVPPKGDF